jgi:pentapeptide MXKDX repeat protein
MPSEMQIQRHRIRRQSKIFLAESSIRPGPSGLCAALGGGLEPPKKFCRAVTTAATQRLESGGTSRMQTRIEQDETDMTISTRLALGFSAAALSLSLAFAPAAFAQDKMGKDDGMMKKDTMAKESMKKDGMSKDAMSKDGMSKDGMHKDGMKKDEMKK